jgi:hypothetical protein
VILRLLLIFALGMFIGHRWTLAAVEKRPAGPEPTTEPTFWGAVDLDGGVPADV